MRSCGDKKSSSRTVLAMDGMYWMCNRWVVSSRMMARIDGLRDYADSHVSDSQMASATMRFPVNTPTTKEGFLYRSIYAEHFPSRDAALVSFLRGGDGLLRNDRIVVLSSGCTV